MNEIILELAALPLSLFCLVYSLTALRSLYFPLPKGAAVLKSRHLAFLLAVGATIVTALASVAYAFGQAFQVDMSTLSVLNGLFTAFRILAFVFFALYILNLAGLVKKLSSTNRAITLILVLVVLAGVLIQAVWSVPIERLFLATALFGFMALLEHGEDDLEIDLDNRSRSSLIIAVAVTFLLAIVINVALIQSLTNAQSDKIGNVQLDIISNDLEDTISEAEANLLHIALGAEQLLDSNASRDELMQYFNEQKDSLQSNESFMNAYIAGSNWHIVPDFDAPEDFHAAERVWYLGAKENPGKVFISEPYIDANTGAMCFTASTMLSDGQTVVAMDLNFSKPQDTISQMTTGTDQTAMIVTSEGLIAGYSDMSLVGERADEKLPEYADVIHRVANSNEHDSFRTDIDGRTCVVFSSETENGWHLVLSVNADALYAENFRQIATMLAINLLMLVVVVVFFMLNTRNRKRVAMVLTENERFLTSIADKLHQPAMRILQLSDERLLDESPDPVEISRSMRESGQQLNELADSVQAYSVLIRERSTQLEQRNAKRHADSTSAPSRNARNGIIATLVAALAISLFFSISITIGWGDARMNRDADKFENQLNEWIAQQKSILYAFTDTISARPDLMDDYDAAVRLLDSIAQDYPQISACYMANPYLEPPVIMNNGWIPDEDDRPETRPWYKETERSAEHFNISAPYFDVQTGNYCITLSRLVDSDQSAFLGIFGIDFFLDKLINVLGESYTSDSYAFLIDSNGIIVNHPNAAYQMGEGNSISIEDTEYAEAYNSDGVTVLRDHTGKLVACLCRTTDSGFTVMVANSWWSVYGSVVFVSLAFIVLFGICIAIITLLINRLIRWQETVNQQLVEAAEAAVSAGQAKSRFLAQMSHEIRTPMNAIIGLDSIALRDSDISPQTREYLEKINASAKHLLSLINDILDMSRIESGRMTLKEKDFSLHELLDQINVIVNGQCDDKGLIYECTLAENVGDRFVGDDLKLKQAIINILGNSVKFTEPPGSVTLAVEQTGNTDENCTLRFVMKDTGVGMDEEFIPKLFETFSQEDSAEGNQYGGTGLGMAITKNFIEMMGGTIDVESEKGVGSTFTVSVPLARGHEEDPLEVEAATAAGQPPVEEASLEGLHVLIAEDMELNADILIDLLDMEDITSEWAENGQVARDLFARSEEGHFGAVLMDMRMPVMDGLTATREIRGLDHPDAKRIPIVALTANAFEEDVKTCLEAGMDAHVAKPVDIDLLLKTLRQLIAKR